MTTEAIKAAIEQLPPAERLRLADWFDEVKERDWDKQMERDFSPGGRGYHLGEAVERDIANGQFTALEEGLTSRRKHS